jgi:hypothetical protein
VVILWPDNITDAMLNYFETNRQHANPGTTYNDIEGDVVDNDVKQSLDYAIQANANHWPIYDYRKCLHECLDMYIQKYIMLNDMSFFNIVEDYNIQYYPIGGGFKKWHSERSAFNKASRILVFMTYLNDVEDGGTEFMYQNFKIPR